MKILSIRLHPFAGTRDRTIHFDNGVNVLEGPNEAGKSTLRSALFHTLFTPTDLTPAKFTRTMSRWLPRPSGDHVRVTLVFNFNGIKHTVVRRWGTKPDTTLVREGLPDMADPRKVQEIIQDALRWNEATWQHVLFIDQAKLNQTLHDLQADRMTSDLEEILQNTGAVDGDIPAEKLIAALNARIGSYYSHWDRNAARPEKGRGLEDRWIKEVGIVLKSWYKKEELKQQLDQVLQHEHDLDQVNAQIARITQAMEADRAFVEDGRSRKDGLHKRALVEQRLLHSEVEIARLMKVMVEWPGADQILKDKKEALKRCEQELEKLKAEIANAKLHEGSEKVRQGYQALSEAKRSLEEAQKEIASLKPVKKQQIDELRKVVQQIERIEVEIKAQKLAAILQVSSPMSVLLLRGSGEDETVQLSPGNAFHCTAEGKISISAGELKISVRSDQKDVEQLYSDLEKIKLKYTELLSIHSCSDLAELIARKENFDLATQKADRASATFTASLQKRTEEEWQKAIDDLKNIPPARSLGDLENEKDRVLKEQAKFNAEKKILEKNLEEWVRAFASLDQLMVRVVDLRTSLATDQKELSALPELPAGFSDTKTFLDRLRSAEQIFDRSKEILEENKLKLATLQGRVLENSAEDLKEQHALAQREFQRFLDEARSYERILRRVQALEKRKGSDPFAGLTERVTHYVDALTDGRYKPQFKGVQPIGVDGNNSSFEPSLLSQGTQGCLALAVRLAYAEIYLANNDGFMIMDDPLTDMDPDRRKCAVTAIKDFAQKHQVIVLTCHPEHAALFTSHGARHQMLQATEVAAVAR